MKTKSCKQCGELKPIELFRNYYGNRKGSYTTCKACEKINSREKYLANKNQLSGSEQEELRKIHELWEYQTELGLRPPRTKEHVPSSIDLDEMLYKYGSRARSVQNIINHDAPPPPPELVKWLTEPLVDSPEDYQDTVYEQLREKYRPYVRIDDVTMLPIYDDTYKDTLLKIAKRFDEYEDEYYKEEKK